MSFCVPTWIVLRHVVRSRLPDMWRLVEVAEFCFVAFYALELLVRLCVALAGSSLATNLHA